jgi:type VI secretion system protein ImpL
MTKRKLFLLILVFILYEVLVWLGALLFLGDSSLLVGFVLTVCGLTVLLVYFLVTRLSAAQAPQPAASSSEPGPTAPLPAPSPGRSSPASNLIQEANEQLAKSPTLASQRVKSTIRDFPLYFVLGAEGSGKTSLFLASKFQPELLAGQVHRDSAVVPTKSGNIWFAEGAVVVEAAGDFFSGELSRWSDFMASFHRPGGKSRVARIFGESAETRLSGVLLCCDASAFVGVPDSARLAAIARLAQQRLRAVGEIFGRDFPVYFIFTKSDSIPYFNEYFGRLAESEDTQVLGCAFPGTGAASETNETITAGLNKLYLSLADKRLEFLEREKEIGKRPAIYEFPREFKRLRGPLVQFLLDIFRPNPLQPNPRLLGVYFSGTRRVVGQASELDRSVIHKVGDVTRILRADDLQRLRSQIPEARERESEITRWSFVADLWQQILQRRPTAGTGLYINQKQKFYRKLALLSTAAACALATLLFFNSFLRNHFLVTEVRAAALQTEPVRLGTAPSAANLQEIEVLRSTVEALVKNRPGLFMHFGFYEGGRLRDPAWRVYYTRFREYFLNPVVRRLEDQLSSLPPAPSSSYPYGAVYANLQTYRTITRSPHEASCTPDSALGDRMLGVWRQDHPVDAEGERIAKANFQFFVSSLKSGRIPDELQIASKDDGVVQPGRRYLRTFKGAEPQYHRIIEQVNHEMQSTARLADLTRNTRYRSVVRVQEEVPAAFTRSGSDRVQQLIESAAAGNASESCVLGSADGPVAEVASGAALKTQLRELYINDYIRNWSDFLASASVLPYNGCRDAADKLGNLKENNSPLLAVLVLASENTTFPKHQGSPLQQVGQKLDTARKGFRLPFGKSKDEARAQAGKALSDALNGGPNEDEITATFQPARAVFDNSAPNHDHWADPRNTPYLNSLGELGRALDVLDRGGKCDESNQAANNEANAALAKAQGVLDGLVRNFDNRGAYDSVKAFLTSPLLGAKMLITSDPSEVAKRKIGGAQQQLCAALSSLKSKYPFNPQGDDASLDQVGKVFDPKDGLLAGLRQTLQDLVVKSPGGNWTQKPDAPVKLSRGFLDFFNHMSSISEALFPQPTKYGLSVGPNPAIKQVTGTVDGQAISMSNKEYFWPAAKPEINLRVDATAGGSSPLRSYSSIWGIFRLLSNAERMGTNQFRLVNVQGGGGNPQPILPDGSAIVFEVTQFPNGVAQAFDKGFFTVSCPARTME